MVFDLMTHSTFYQSKLIGDYGFKNMGKRNVVVVVVEKKKLRF
jgi:hypothetical protein